MDDGSRDITESLDLLRTSRQQGITTIVASSHYYQSRESIDEFLTRRQSSFEQLSNAMTENGLPNIWLGAEVAFYSGMSKDADLERLKIQGTDSILIEMPFSIWTSGTLNEIYSIFSNTNLTPVLAHVERYPDFSANSSKLNDLVDMGVLFQMNGEYIIASKSRRHALDLLKHGDHFLLGSDAHNMESRRPNLGDALALIEKKLGSRRIMRIHELGKSLISEE